MKDLLYRHRWLLGGVVLAAAGAFGLSRLEGDVSRRRALDVVPVQARAIARIDVGAVLRSHLFETLLEEDTEGGVRRIERTCGYDPLEEVEDVLVFVFGADDDPFEHLGFVARGQMARGDEQRERLVGCVQQVLRQDGGAVHEIEVEGVPAIASAHGSSYAAFIGSDGVVGGDREAVSATLRVASGQAPAARTNALLARLWDRVSTGRDIVLVGRLPERWLPALNRLARLGEEDMDLVATLSGVRAFGVGATVRQGLSVGATLNLASPAHARDLARAFHERVDAELDDPMARFSVIGAALRRVRVEAQASDVVVTLSVSENQIDEVLGLWRELRERGTENRASEGEGGGESESEGESEAESEGESESEAESER